jgi:hypothetical protein
MLTRAGAAILAHLDGSALAIANCFFRINYLDLLVIICLDFLAVRIFRSISPSTLYHTYPTIYCSDSIFAGVNALTRVTERQKRRKYFGDGLLSNGR